MLGSQSSEDAQRQYVGELTEHHSDWMQPDTASKKLQPAGPVVSSLAGADEQQLVRSGCQAGQPASLPWDEHPSILL